MNIELGYSQLCVGYGLNKENNLSRGQLEARVVVAVCVCSTSNWTNLLVDFEAESPGRVLCPANPRPYVNTKLFSRVLKDFAEHFGVGQAKRIILPLDQASWHEWH